MNSKLLALGAGTAVAIATLWSASIPAQAQQPNIVVIMGDDSRDLEHRRLPPRFDGRPHAQSRPARRRRHGVHRLLRRGQLYRRTCNFITGELPIRTGLTTVGQAGSPIGMPAEAPRSPPRLKSMGFTPQANSARTISAILNQFLPTLHGFDEFYGYLYHLDAMEDPCHVNYPPALKATVGPRNMSAHALLRTSDDPTVQHAAVGQESENRGIEGRRVSCGPKRMGDQWTTQILAIALQVRSTRRGPDRKPFFLWLNPTRMHVITHLSDKYQKMRTPENGWSIQEAGMAQLDDIVGSVMKHLKDNGLEQNTIIAFTTDNGTENFSWPDGGQTPFAGGKGTVMGRWISLAPE